MKNVFFILLSLLVLSCSDDKMVQLALEANDTRAKLIATSNPTLPTSPYNYSKITLPKHLTANVLLGSGQNAASDNDNTPANNAITDHGATLGRVLFYDKNLSANRTVSCGSCHQAAKGFADNLKQSDGFNGGKTRRNTMSLVNAKFYKRGKFFWDERASTLEQQVLMPIQDQIEMGLTSTEIVERVKEQTYYTTLFQNAFGSTEVSNDKISKALSQFIRSMVSTTSKYDIGRANVNLPTQNFSNFTTSENNGKRLFFQPLTANGAACVGCHSTESFINPDKGTTANGIDAVSTTDLGVYESNPFSRFLGTFKVPSLKNIALTAPYMHDGRFATLQDVVNHYSDNVQNHVNLSVALKDANGNPVRLKLTSTQKTDLINFLNTLSDTAMLNDMKFSDPFLK